MDIETMRTSKEQRKLLDKQESMLNRVFHSGEQCSQKDYNDLQTFCAIAIEVMRKCEPELLKEAATTVEARGLTRELRK